MSEIPVELERFWARYECREPQVDSLEPEKWLLDYSTGLRILEYTPTTDVDYGYPPKSQSPPAFQRVGGLHPYLWVLTDGGILFIKETPIAELNSALPKHTNLTGGKPAYVGGQLWFETGESIFVSGGSGRYKPIDAEQLEAAVGVFRAFGYNPISLGWDELRNEPRRTL